MASLFGARVCRALCFPYVMRKVIAACFPRPRTLLYLDTSR
jgi:hypothetical protein